MDSVTIFGETFALPLTNEAKCKLTEWIIDPDSSTHARQALQIEEVLLVPDRVFLLTTVIYSIQKDPKGNAWAEDRALLARALRLARTLEGEERRQALVQCADCLHSNFQDSSAALVLYEEADIPYSKTGFLTLEQHGLDDVLRSVIFSDLWKHDWEALFTHIRAISGCEASEYLFNEIGDLLLEMGEMDQALHLAEVQGEGWDHFGPLHLKILRHVFGSHDWERAEQILKKIAANPLGVTEQELRFCDRILTLPLGARPEEVRRLQHWYGYGTPGEEL